MFRARLGVRTRILAIALVPSLTLLVVGVGAAGYLVVEGNETKDWVARNQQAIPATREVLEAVQSERQLTLAALTGDAAATPALGVARMRLDGALKSLLDTSAGLQAVDDSKSGNNAANFITLSTSMNQVRSLTDAGTLPVPDAYNFYNRLIDGITYGTEIAKQTAPDAQIGVHIANGMRISLVAEALSRSTALGGMIVNANEPTPIPLEEYVRQIGFYHAEAANLAAELDPKQQESLHTLMASQAWQQVTAMENALAQRNTTAASTTSSSSNSSGSSSSTTKQSTPPALPLSTQEWHSAATEVNRGLIDVWFAQTEYSQKLAERTVATATARSAWAGGGVAVVSLLAFAIAIVLANRVINRLERLRGQTLALADEQLPELMRRLGTGEHIDPAAESAELEYGHDEIGQVAKAFQHAHAAAVAGAVTEARTREGVKAVFLNIAHRSQIVVHRQLEILDKAEERQEDPALLDILFRLDHLAARERRNAENLIILGNGQPGRQWRNPVPLIDLVRSAVGETLDYARVRVSRLPETHVLGAVVADLIHLLAELVDNATAFSPPQSRVEVSGNVVGKGVVIEIRDQGMGMAESEIARVNEMLRNPPDFGVAALSSDSRLGLFVVAQLAHRHGVSIRLSESDYGGIRAIVLIPSALLANEQAALTSDPEPLESARRRRHPVPFVESATYGGAEIESAVLTAPPLAPAVEAPPAVEARSAIETPSAVEAPAPRPVFEVPQPISADTRPALPRRKRQASIAPQLAQPTPAAPAAEQSPERSRTAEQARDLMSAIENGTKQGRRAVPDAVPPEEAAAERFGTLQGPSGKHSDEQEGNGDYFQPR